MDNPSIILQTVDRRLDHEVKLVIYGRAALFLGFNSPPPASGGTQDVDAIISIRQEGELKKDFAFWDAVEGANEELSVKGLYMTHLFSEREVFLRQDWEVAIVPVTRPILTHLRGFRPATIDLILSKMMRGNDPQDMSDAEFMIRHDGISELQLLEAFEQMKAIDLVELRDAFKKAKPIVLALARANAA